MTLPTAPPEELPENPPPGEPVETEVQPQETPPSTADPIRVAVEKLIEKVDFLHGRENERAKHEKAAGRLKHYQAYKEKKQTAAPTAAPRRGIRFRAGK